MGCNSLSPSTLSLFWASPLRTLKNPHPLYSFLTKKKKKTKKNKKTKTRLLSHVTSFVFHQERQGQTLHSAKVVFVDSWRKKNEEKSQKILQNLGVWIFKRLWILEMLTGLCQLSFWSTRPIVNSPETKVAHFKGPCAEICWSTLLPAWPSPAPAAACLTALMPRVLQVPLSSVLWRLQGGAEGRRWGRNWVGRGPKQRPNQSWFSGTPLSFLPFLLFYLRALGKRWLEKRVAKLKKKNCMKASVYGLVSSLSLGAGAGWLHWLCNWFLSIGKEYKFFMLPVLHSVNYSEKWIPGLVSSPRSPWPQAGYWLRAPASWQRLGQGGW